MFVKGLLFSVSFLLLFLSGRTQEKANASFEWAACPKCPLPDADTGYLRRTQLLFGYLTVPENRQKNNGRRLRIAVEVLKSRDPHTQAPPLVILHGGPGGRLVGTSFDRFLKLRETRDVILVDQRGCGFSEPEFPSGMNQKLLNMLSMDLTPGQEREMRTQIAEKELRDLAGKGIDLSAYNGDEIAADINDLCHLMGYHSWDLWGGSYGSRIALEMMRKFPEGIHGVILESPLPPNVPYFQNITANLKKSLNLLFNKCESDAACRLAYPHLRSDFFEAIDSLEKKPMTVHMHDKARFPDGKFVINAQDILLGIQQALYGKPIYPVLPLLIEQLKDRNEAVMESFVESMANGIFALRYGYYYSVVCKDCMPFNDLKAYEDSSSGLGDGLTFYKDQFSVCKMWNTDPADNADSAAVTSDIPVLILSGELDPIASTEGARKAANTLQHSYLYVFQNTGHFVSFEDYAPTLIGKFLADPSRQPDSNRTIRAADINFTTNVHLSGGISALAPKLRWIKENRMYNIWLAVIAVAFVLSLFFAIRGILLGKGRFNGSPREGIFYWSSLTGAILGIYFLVQLIMAISRTAAQNYFLLAFGLPGTYAAVLYLPYLILVLYLLSIAAVVTNRKTGIGYWLLLLNIPFLLLIFRYDLFY